MTLAEFAAAPLITPLWLARAFVVAWGCIWGSFLNVVIYRVPRESSIVRPGSRCTGCGAPIRAKDNVPVVSWFFLRGRARCCGAPISPRYVVVELIAGLLALAVYEVGVRPLAADTTIWHAGAIFLADFALAMALLAAAFIDAEHMYLPDTITIGGALFGVATPGLRGLSFVDAILGASIGFLGVWLPFIVGYKAIRGRPGMGLGDAKLVMLAGAWFGWQGVAFAVFAGAVQATMAAGIMLASKGKIEEPESVRRDREEIERAASAGDEEARRVLEEDPLGKPPAEGILAARLPFGPFLCLAIIEWMLAGSWIRDRWTQ